MKGNNGTNAVFFFLLKSLYRQKGGYERFGIENGCEQEIGQYTMEILNGIV